MLHRLSDLIRQSFLLRLLLGVVVALAAAGATSYGLMTRELRTELLRSAVEQQRTELEAILADTAARTRTEREQFALSSLVTRIGGHRDVRAFAVIDPAGNLLAVSGRPPRQARISEATRVARTGRERAELQLAPARFGAVVPVGRAPAHYAIVIDRLLPHVDREVAAVHRSLITAGLVAAIVAVLLIYLLAGRALNARHRSALERATRDSLTGLGNHRAYGDELARAVAVADRELRDFALAVVDIDDFKFVNDRHGHGHGDQVLQAVAAGLGAEVRAGDRVFRTGGDEFAVLLPGCDGRDAVWVLERVRRILSTDRLTVSVGVSATRPGMRDGARLREEADAALYEAKRQGRDATTYFGDICDRVVLRTAEQAVAIRAVIGERAVDVAYQPIWNLADGGLLGVEALARPQGGHFDGPSRAFDVAEQAGLVPQLDRLCAERAFEGARSLPAGVLLFVNLSPTSLDSSHGSLEWMRLAALAAGLEPYRVVVEITERLDSRERGTLEGAHRLREMGFGIALDDVGAGSAGLGRLRSLRADFVKIDRGVICAASEDPAARAVLAAISAFAFQTGATVIAEGIEDEDMLRYVHSVGGTDAWSSATIRGGQGYGLTRPQASLSAALEAGAAAHVVAPIRVAG